LNAVPSNELGTLYVTVNGEFIPAVGIKGACPMMYPDRAPKTSECVASMLYRHPDLVSMSYERAFAIASKLISSSGGLNVVNYKTASMLIDAAFDYCK